MLYLPLPYPMYVRFEKTAYSATVFVDGQILVYDPMVFGANPKTERLAYRDYFGYWKGYSREEAFKHQII